jgi:Raf kinase inhibitor-like YbhB/YbcL family protein
MKRVQIAFGLLIFTTCLISDAISQEAAKARLFRISSPAFEDQGMIPAKYTCDGENVNPPLKIENVPGEAKSLALIFDDLDAPKGSYVHWILWNIPPTVTEIRENSVPAGAVQGLNGFKKQSYGGPCPPTRPHRYAFRFYALDIHLDLKPESAKKDLENAIAGHVLQKSQIMGSFKKKK